MSDSGSRSAGTSGMHDVHRMFRREFGLMPGLEVSRTLRPAA